MSVGKFYLTLTLLFFLIFPAKAEEPKPSLPDLPLQQLEESAKQFLTMLEYLIMAIPQYEAPELLENGDIIIRRKPSGSKEPQAPAPSDKTTEEHRKI